MRYRRYFVPGGCYFFMVVTENRQKILTLPSSYAFLQGAFDKVKQDRPFVLEALVILPDHLHCIWKLPPGDYDFFNPLAFDQNQVYQAISFIWIF